MLAKLAEEASLFSQGLDLRLKSLMLGLKMFGSELKLLALGLGVLIVPLQFVAADLQILESASEQFEFIFGLLAFSFPLVAARFEEGHQFPQGTSELEMRHDFRCPFRKRAGARKYTLWVVAASLVPGVAADVRHRGPFRADDCCLPLPCRRAGVVLFVVC